ncbi:MAG: polynucleotide kinase-phosphatase [Nannocystaceae bacterium]
MSKNAELDIPELCLVVLVGVSGAGKSTFASKHFLPTEVVSSDFCRGLVADDDNDQKATSDAFDVLHYIAGKRLARGRLTVVDATSVQPEARKGLVQLARQHDCLAVAIVLNVPPKVAGERNESRDDRNFGMRVVKQQHAQLRRGLRGMKREGFSRVHILDSVEEIEAVTISRRKLWNDRREDAGPFDIIGDVHGCYAELEELLCQLGYEVSGTRELPAVKPPEGRRAIFLGDLVDRGPDSPGVLRLAMSMVESGAAICIPGNHEVKLLKKLRGKNVRMTHGLAETVEQLSREPEAFHEQVAEFINGLVSHYVLDDGRLVVAHAGLTEQYQGRASGRVRAFCLYGETMGETDEFGLPVRYDWASEYRGRAMVVYGHTPVPEAEWVNGTICIDTGCVFGGKLTALRYPDRELVQVDAHETYYEPAKPLESERQSERPRHVLDIADVTGKRIVDTRVRHTVTIREENAVAALEVMSRFAMDPRWLIYLPPTMSPAETAPSEVVLLERPQEALGYFASNGVARVVCQEKHMGSRAVLVVARSVEAAEAKFGVGDGKQGVIYTRTGRPFFSAREPEAELVSRIAGAFEAAGLWDELGTDWACLDAELMPWSLKAVELLRTQYAAVGAAAGAALDEVVRSLESATERGSAELLERFRTRREMVEGYSAAWRRYCWTTNDIADVKLAPFHLLATEGNTYFDKSHVWHMDTMARLAEHEPIVVATPYRTVELADEAQRVNVTAWWEELTGKGGEGMVIKPEHWIVRGKRGLVQPALKCRGPEYLRIIYGPEYTALENVERLRQRGLSTKRSLAIREFVLGLEGLYRFAEAEPLWRVHECVFGVLALESEPVDPRL